MESGGAFDMKIPYTASARDLARRTQCKTHAILSGFGFWVGIGHLAKS